MTLLGTDCQIILDGQGYWIEPTTFQVARPRVRTAVHNRTASNAITHAGAGERYVDLGPGKREWTFSIVAFQAIRTYSGAFVSQTGQQFRDALQASYEKVNTALSFTDPAGTVWNVRFDALTESLVDVRAQPDGELQYYLHVVLVEA